MPCSGSKLTTTALALLLTALLGVVDYRIGSIALWRLWADAGGSNDGMEKNDK